MCNPLVPHHPPRYFNTIVIQSLNEATFLIEKTLIHQFISLPTYTDIYHVVFLLSHYWSMRILHFVVICAY